MGCHYHIWMALVLNVFLSFISVHMQNIRLCLLSSQGLADNTVIAKVNNSVWDLDRPLEEDCSLQLLKFDDEEAQAVSRPRYLGTLLLFSPYLCN